MTQILLNRIHLHDHDSKMLIKTQEECDIFLFLVNIYIKKMFTLYYAMKNSQTNIQSMFNVNKITI